MSTKTFSPGIIRKQGLKTLTKTLGREEMMRILEQLETENGDTAKEGENESKNPGVKAMVEKIKSERKVK